MTTVSKQFVGSKAKHPVVATLLWIAALIWLFPILGTLLVSFRSQDDLTLNGFWSLPETLSWANYQFAWTQGNMSSYIVNSFIITVPAILGMLFFSSLAAYAIIRFRTRFSLPLYFLFVSGILLPPQILLIPVFQLSGQLGIYNSFWALIIFHMSFQIGFCTFVLRNFMLSVPTSLFEAAVIDGASEWSIYRRIAVPIIIPAFASVTILEFTWIFNDYIWALVLVRTNALKPVTTGLATMMGQYTNNWPNIIAGSIIATIPTIIVFLLLQRYFIGGLTMGATKG